MDIVMTDCAPPPDPDVLHAAIFESAEGMDGELEFNGVKYVRFNFRFALDKLRDWSPTFLAERRMNQRTQLGRFMRGMLDRPIETGEGLSKLVDALIGKEFRIRVRHKMDDNGEVEFINVSHAEPVMQDKKLDNEALKSKTKA
jgi:hypothetical protein